MISLFERGGDLSGKKNNDKAPFEQKILGKTLRKKAPLSHKDKDHSKKNPL